LDIQSTLIFYIIDLECGVIDQDPSTTIIAKGSELGQIVEYSCAEGFDGIVGDIQRTCEVSGEWTGSAPVCSAIGNLNV